MPKPTPVMADLLLQLAGFCRDAGDDEHEAVAVRKAAEVVEIEGEGIDDTLVDHTLKQVEAESR